MNKKKVFGDLQVKKSELFVSLVFYNQIIDQKKFSEDSKHIYGYRNYTLIMLFFI